MADDAVKFTDDKVFVIKDDKAFDPVTGAELKLPDDAEDVVNNNLMRGALDAAQAALKLTSKDDAVRAEAAQALFKEPDESRAAADREGAGRRDQRRRSRRSSNWCAPPAC